MKTKFCGIRSLQDVEYMNQFLPDYVCFIFAKSKRQIGENQAKFLSENLDSRIKKVGVVVNENIENIIRLNVTASLDVIQLHGDEDDIYIKELREKFVDTQIWKAVRVKSVDDIKKAENLDVDMLLLDSFSEKAYGGTGKTIDLEAIKNSGITKPFFIAGGINSENIISIFRGVQPYGVDISSGIEKDGVKDYAKIYEIVRCLECIKQEDSAILEGNMSLKQ